MIPDPITWISYRIGDDPNGTLFLVSIRVVPTAQEGNTVFGRSFNYGESDDGRGIERRLGGRVLFPPGSLKITIDDVDRRNTPGLDGYAPLANTIWTWLTAGPSPDETIFLGLSLSWLESRDSRAAKLVSQIIAEEVSMHAIDGFVEQGGVDLEGQPSMVTASEVIALRTSFATLAFGGAC